MRTLYVHLRWFFFMAGLFFSFLLLSLFVSFSNCILYFSFPIFSSSSLNLDLSFTLDYISLWFLTVIIVISMIISVYSYFYMSPYRKSIYFLWTIILFVFSILLVVRISNLFFIMLGWDGLGLVSFFLIVYYQNQSSIVSGVFTLLINRLGDCFFLVSIVFFYYFSSDLFVHTSNVLPRIVLIVLLLTFITKRALFPFSSWLPMAIAAPTPISALVHSSTLVTSGLFLMVRYSYYLYSSYSLIKLFLLVRVFTSFYAGLNTLFEKDLKKLIALSTLRHLGFIGLSFSSGLLSLAYFHMLSHALFKSLLFMTIGDIIINLSHSQDIRYLSSGYSLTPFSSSLMLVPIINLLGLPSLVGFFSKDLVLEMLNYSFFSGFVLTISLINVFFTFYYRFQLFYYSFSLNKTLPYNNFNSPLFLHSFLMALLSILTLLAGKFFIVYLFPSMFYVVVPVFLKFFPSFLLVLFIGFIFLFLKLFVFFNPKVRYYFSTIIFLSEVRFKVSSLTYFLSFSSIIKRYEIGFIRSLVNTLPSVITYSVARVLFSGSLINPLLISLFSLFILLIFLF